MGHEDQFAPPGLSDRRRFGQPTFTGTHWNERDAPVADTRRVTTANRVRCSAVGVRSDCPRFVEAEGVKA